MFRSKTRRFRHKVVQTRKYTEGPPELPEAFNFTSILYTSNTHSETQISLCFALRPAVFKIQGCQKLSMHRMTPE